MLQQIKIKNFQSHKDSTLDFEPGVNIIQGMSDSGKSAVQKALSFTINNDFSGDSFITHGEKECSVEVKVDNHSVIRNKGKSNNYVVDGSELRAIGRGVPEEIEKLFNMNEINIQKQFDGYFLLSETPGEVAKKLNKAVDLDIIDTVNSNINSKHRASTTDINYIEKNISQINIDLIKYREVDSLDVKAKALRVLWDAKNTAEELKNSMRGLGSLWSTALTKTKQDTLDLINKETVLKQALDISEKLTSINTLKAKIESIRTLIQENTVLNEKNTVDKEKVVLQSKSIESAESRSVQLTIKEEAYIKLKEKCNIIKILLDEHKINVYNTNNSKELLNLKEKELSDITPDVCPLCGK